MDKIEEAATVIIALNRYRNGEIKDYDLIKKVCAYFDQIKDEKLTEPDRRFLKYISNTVGIPHFFDLLAKFNQDINIKNFDLNTLSAIIYESTLNVDEKNKVHRYQKQILGKFNTEKLNRYFLSASTSFGKTHIVFEIIKKIRYKNVVLLFPTIALLSENLEKILSDDNYSNIFQEYKVHTISEAKVTSERNIFIFTPERFLSFIEKTSNAFKFDLAFIDEVYKIDNDYIIDDLITENERDVAYRLAVHYALQNNADVLLAGPYIEFSNKNDINYNDSFDNFLSDNLIEVLDYNNYEIVNKNYKLVSTKSDNVFDDHLSFNFRSKKKGDMLLEIIRSTYKINENTIVYCPRKQHVGLYTKRILKSEILKNHDSSLYLEFIKHVSEKFDPRWLLVDALKNGIGMHHGLIPKYIQKEIIHLFNHKQLTTLLSTTTITEGVNTNAKNLIVTDSFKGKKKLKKFDAKNISGRAGRFMKHYSGRVIVLKNNFLDIMESEPEGIKHKNYDINSPKDEIDLFYSDDIFLNENDKLRRVNVLYEQTLRNMPDFVFDYYKVVSRIDKITVYDNISKFSATDFLELDKLVYIVNSYTGITFEGFQLVLNAIRPIVKNKKLIELIDAQFYSPARNKRYSLLCVLVFSYLKNGFKGSFLYKVDRQGKGVDSAIYETADFIYNTLKYQVVKYIGVFNIMYKLYLSKVSSKSFDEVSGIEKLLLILEYNALTEKGRIASDYGVPSKIIDYYENGESQTIRQDFDNYELSVFERVDKIVQANSNL